MQQLALIRIKCLVLPAVLALAVVLLYWQGLSGTFHLDDAHNLRALSQVDEPGGFQDAVLRPTSKTPGRPLSRLSFALQAESWPSDPAAFIRINLVIHVLNSVLVFLVMMKLASLVPALGVRPRTFACLVSLFWALAPIHVSAVLYVVQRMTLLAGSFSLLGIYGYLQARSLFRRERVGHGYCMLTLSFGLALCLGVLCKESAVLLPLYLLVLENTLLAREPRPRYWSTWKKIFLWGPLALCLAYLLVKPGMLAGYAIRDFTLPERLLTEARVLIAYLGSIFWPASERLGIYHDAFQISRGFLQPVSTLWAVLAIALLLITGFLSRSKYPAFACALLWFLGGHALESSFIPLEIYFEHRNYLPTLGLALGLMLSALYVLSTIPSRLIVLALRTVAVVYLLLNGSVAYQEAKLWGEPQKLAVSKSKAFPESKRARQSLQIQLVEAGQFQMAAQLLREGYAVDALPPGILGQLLYLRCADPTIQIPEAALLPGLLENAERAKPLFSSLENIVTVKEIGACEHLATDYVNAVLRLLLHNPAYRAGYPELAVMQAKLYAHVGDYARAMASLDQSLRQAPNALVALQKVDYALAANEPAAARAFLADSERMLAEQGWRAARYRSRLEHYRERVEASASKNSLRDLTSGSSQKAP